MQVTLITLMKERTVCLEGGFTSPPAPVMRIACMWLAATALLKDLSIKVRTTVRAALQIAAVLAALWLVASLVSHLQHPILQQ